MLTLTTDTWYGTVSGEKTWAHATSTDLYHWKVHDIAIYGGGKRGSAWSGSAVVDYENTSGFFGNLSGASDGVVAIYTRHFDGDEVQAIAMSYDNGFTFDEDWPKNPVIDIKNPNFRDPKVIWHEPTRRWIMVVAHVSEQFVEFYSSTNLIKWRSESKFPVATGAECPNLVPIPYLEDVVDAWPQDLPKSQFASGNSKKHKSTYLLFFSGGGNPLNGDSVTRYAPGIFNGTHFTPFDNRLNRVIDFGPDNYAPQFFFDRDQAPPVAGGWKANCPRSSQTSWWRWVAPQRWPWRRAPSR